MSKRQINWKLVDRLVSYSLTIAAIIAIVVGFVKINDTQQQIRHEAHRAIVSEQSARQHAEAVACETLNQANNTLRAAIEAVLKPADLTGLSPERLPVVQRLNDERAIYRTQLLSQIPPNRDCG